MPAQQRFPVGSLRHSLYYRQGPDQQPSRCALCVVAQDTLRAPLWSQAWTSSVPRGLHRGRLWICRRFWPSPALNPTPSPSQPTQCSPGICALQAVQVFPTQGGMAVRISAPLQKPFRDSAQSHTGGHLAEGPGLGGRIPIVTSFCNFLNCMNEF